MVKNKKGFTLIELVVVVAILGILTLLIVPNVVGRVNEAKEAVVNANIKVINNAIKLYYTIEGKYPDSTSLDNLLNDLSPKYLDANEIDAKAKEQITVVVDQNTGEVKVQKK
nr:prepilin-type N-terminal cleavage/methylation domain-containing protein [Caldicoprobacter guelmensis]